MPSPGGCKIVQSHYRCLSLLLDVSICLHSLISFCILQWIFNFTNEDMKLCRVYCFCSHRDLNRPHAYDITMTKHRALHRALHGEAQRFPEFMPWESPQDWACCSHILPPSHAVCMTTAVDYTYTATLSPWTKLHCLHAVHFLAPSRAPMLWCGINASGLYK